MSEPSRGKGRLKAGRSQYWLTHNLGGMVSRIKKYAALDSQSAAARLLGTQPARMSNAATHAAGLVGRTPGSARDALYHLSRLGRPTESAKDAQRLPSA